MTSPATEGTFVDEEIAIQLVQLSLTKELSKEKNKWKAVRYIFDYVVNFEDSAFWYLEKGVVYNLNDMAVAYAENNAKHYGIDYERLFGIETEITTNENQTSTEITSGIETTTATETTAKKTYKSITSYSISIIYGPEKTGDLCVYGAQINIVGDYKSIIWNRDDSKGNWGPTTVQVNLNYGEDFILSAKITDYNGKEYVANVELKNPFQPEPEPTTTTQTTTTTTTTPPGTTAPETTAPETTAKATPSSYLIINFKHPYFIEILI